MSKTSPFDLQQLQDAQEKAPPPPEPVYVTATDNIRLAVRVYEPNERTRGILLFYHGGGAHSAAGYPILARGLADEYGIKVYTPDLRGHGESQGPRGDSPTEDQVYQDIISVIEFIRKENEIPTIPLYLGGHSSGAGLIIQYCEKKSQADIAGYLLLSPQLGPNANVGNESSAGFASVSILPFILNGVFGIMGNYPAVKFNYTQETIEKSGVVAFNTVNMANAISPTEPGQQLQDMERTASHHTPFTKVKLWMGENDELFDAQKVKSLFAATDIVPGATHLGILVDAHKLLGSWLSKSVEEVEVEMRSRILANPSIYAEHGKPEWYSHLVT